jgi:hypothetical protein
MQIQHFTFPPTVIFTKSFFNIILSRFSLCDVDILHVVVQQTVCHNLLSINVQYPPLTSNIIRKGQRLIHTHTHTHHAVPMPRPYRSPAMQCR